MTSQLIRFLLVLIGLTVCLSNGIYGEDIENKEVLSTPVKNALNKLAEDAVISNVVKREALPDPTAEKRKNRQGKKKESLKNRKRINRHGNKKDSRKNRQRNKKKSLKNRKREKSKGRKKRNRKNRHGKKKHSLKSRRRKNRQGKKKQKTKNVLENKKGRLNKDNGKNIQTRTCPDCAKTISTAIKTYNKYSNYKRIILRIFKWQEIIVRKSKKLERYKTTKASLENVTTHNGTYCPGDPAKNGEVIAVIANLTKCASSKTGGSIVKFCNITRIKDFSQLNKSADHCLNTPTGPLPYNTYTRWIAGFNLCTTANPPTCVCYTVMNDDDNVSDTPINSCKNPNNPPWLTVFSVDTREVFKECNAAIRACKDLETKACSLTSICCEKSSNGSAVTTPDVGRRMQIKASMRKQLQKMKIH